jgi:hypothetical protein
VKTAALWVIAFLLLGVVINLEVITKEIRAARQCSEVKP